MLSPLPHLFKSIITKMRYVDFSTKIFNLNAHFGKSIMDNNHNYFLLAILFGSLSLSLIFRCIDHIQFYIIYGGKWTTGWFIVVFLSLHSQSTFTSLASWLIRKYFPLQISTLSLNRFIFILHLDSMIFYLCQWLKST